MLVLHDVQGGQRDGPLVRHTSANSARIRSLRFLGQARSSVQLRRDDVQTPQHGHHVAQRVPLDQVREDGEMDVRRRPRAGAIRLDRAVSDDVVAQFAVGRLLAA